MFTFCILKRETSNSIRVFIKLKKKSNLIDDVRMTV